MIHYLLSFYDNGQLAMAKSTICTDDEERQRKLEEFNEITLDQGIGDRTAILSQEELLIVHSLDVNEVYDSGV
jgi:hypothetical protein